MIDNYQVELIVYPYTFTPSFLFTEIISNSQFEKLFDKNPFKKKNFMFF